MKGNRYIRFIVLIAVYLVVSIPFKTLEIIPAFSDIRPVTMLAPVYAVFFGPLGCLAFAFGNLITDIVSDSLRYTSVTGFIANFAGPFIIYLYYLRISRDGFRITGLKELLEFALVILVSALAVALIITPHLMIAYPEINPKLFFAAVVLNHSLFPVINSPPLIFLLKEELGFIPYAKEEAADTGE